MIKELTIEKTGLPVGWELTALGKVCEVIAGQSPESKFYNTNEEGLAFYQGKKDFSDKYIGQPTKWTTKITKEAIKNDILMSVRAPVGPVNFSIQKCCIGRGLAAIRASEKIDKEYLYNFLVKFENEIEGNEGAVFNSINKSQIGAIPIPLPPLSQQKQIVAILDKAFAAIDTAKANAEQNLLNAKELFESYLQNVFSTKGDDWEEKTLGNMGDITSSKRIFKNEYVQEGIPYYRSKEIKELALKKEISTKLFIDEQKYFEIRERFGVPKIGDIMLTAIGATIGHIYVLDNDSPFYFKDGNVLWLKNFNELNSNYLKYTLSYFLDHILSIVQGAAYNALTIEKLKRYTIYFPSIKEQEKIVRKLDSVSAECKKLEVIYTQKIADLEEMKKSVLQKAFSGQLSEL
jgi:type I restriction enzyme S subunit